MLPKRFLFFILISFSVVQIFATDDKSIHTAKKIRVALYHDQGARPRGNLIKALESAEDISLTIVKGEELRKGYLNDIDLLLVPGGSAKKQSMSMKETGRDEVIRFVARGGLYIGICAGCYLLTASKPTDLGLLPLGVQDNAHWARGKADIPVEFTPLGQQVFGVNQKMMTILYHNGPIVDASHIPPLSGFSPLAYFRGEIVGRGGKRGIMQNGLASFVGRFGKGWVLGISPHPEAHADQVYIEINAIRWLFARKEM